MWMRELVPGCRARRQLDEIYCPGMSTLAAYCEGTLWPIDDPVPFTCRRVSNPNLGDCALAPGEINTEITTNFLATCASNLLHGCDEDVGDTVVDHQARRPISVAVAETASKPACNRLDEISQAVHPQRETLSVRALVRCLQQVRHPAQFQLPC